VQQSTPRGARLRAGRTSAAALATLGLIAGGVAFASPAAADTVSIAEVAPVATGADPIVAPALRSTATFLRTDRTSVYAGARAILTGKVLVDGVKLPGRNVVLQTRSGTAWHTTTVTRTAGNGFVVFKVYPKRSTEYRLAFAGDATLAASASSGVVVRVQPAARAARVVATAAAQIGKWYRYGAAGPRNFDCSGLTQYSFKRVGVRLPHSANSQKGYGRAVSRSAARPGDLVVFMSGRHAYHVAIYVGNGYMIDAPHSGARVTKRKIYTARVVFRRLV
jgi:cell wall-associated NlpC family hydrolase